MNRDRFHLSAELLSILRCPVSNTKLAQAEQQTQKEIVALVTAGRVFSGKGALVIDPPHVLLRSEAGQLYSSRFGVPLLSAAERLVVDAAAGEAGLQPLVVGQSLEKMASEFDFWVGEFLKEGSFSTGRYPWLFKDIFNFDDSFFAGKRILDIGCGPCGSLEWIQNPGLLVGLDPLSLSYRQFGTHRHRMEYVDAPAERMPFADGSFDIISSLNSLDHVDNVETVLPELERVLAPGGHFVLFTELHEHPTVNEPTTFSWEIRESFPSLRLVFLKEREKDLWSTPFDHSNPAKRYGWLFAVYQKTSMPAVVPGMARVLSSAEIISNLELSNDDFLRACPGYVRDFTLSLIQQQMASMRNRSGAVFSNDEIQRYWSTALDEALRRAFPMSGTSLNRIETFRAFSTQYGFVVGRVVNEFWTGINAVPSADANALAEFTERFLAKIL